MEETIDAGTFEAHRGLLLSIAYRMLGSVADAEDVVQDVYLRSRAASAVRDPRAYLVTAATRTSIDRLRAARRRRERYVGPWLPEPLVGTVPDPSEAAELEDSLSLSFLVMLEALTPVERAALLLHDVFGYGYGEVAEILGRNEPACRQLVHRARRRLERRDARFGASPEKHRELLESFLSACATGDVGALERLLAEDAAVYSDGGGETRAARRPVLGRERAARFLVNLAARLGPDTAVDVERVNAEAGVVLRRDGEVTAVLTIDASRGGIRRVYVVAAPSKLGRAPVGPLRS